MTSSGVFLREQPKRWTAEFAAIGGRPTTSPAGTPVTELESDAELAFAFRITADLVAEHWYDNRADDSLVIAVLYNYRHALELWTKAAIRAFLDSANFEQAPGTETPARLQQIANKLVVTHKLGDLADYLVELAALFRMPIERSVQAVCAEVHALDPDGQALRYPMVKAKGGTLPARPDPMYVNVREFARRAGEACEALDMLLDQIHDLQDAQGFVRPVYTQEGRA